MVRNAFAHSPRSLAYPTTPLPRARTRSLRSQGPGTVHCDRITAGAVLQTMIEAKVEHLYMEGKVLDARAFAALAGPFFMRGFQHRNGLTVPDRTVRYRDRGDSVKSTAADGDEAALENMRKILRWRSDDDENAETEQTGIGLLFWCCLAGNVAAVRALVQDENAGAGSFVRIAARGRVAVTAQALTMDRPDLFSTFQAGMTPLHAAAASGSWEIVEMLFAIGDDPESTTNLGYGKV